MKKAVAISAVLIVIALMCVTVVACSGRVFELPKDGNTFDYEGWDIVWQDEFDGDSLDTAKWKINTMPNDDTNLDGVRRAGYYVDDDDIIFVENSALTIRTKHKSGKHGEGWYTSWVDTSARTEADVDNYKGFSATYGYYEVRCKVPPSAGIWSAFWMMPDGGKAFTDEDIQFSGEDGVEIDIMESPGYYNKGEKNINTHVIHGDGYDDKLKSDKSKTYRVPHMYDTFHTYAVEWDEKEYIFYTDGIETWRTSYMYDNKVMGVSKVNEYMILSVEVGGVNIDGVMYPGKDNWCGDPEKNDKTKNYDFVIDYVRAYQKTA